MPKQIFSINEAASRLGVSTKTLRRWEQKGIISPKRTVGNQRRYSLADIEKADKQSLTIQQAASRLGVSTKTLRRWEQKGIISPQRTSGNQRRYAVSEIETLKDRSPKEILTTNIKRQAGKDLLSLEKQRFFDITSVSSLPATKNRPVVDSSLSPIKQIRSSSHDSTSTSPSRDSDSQENLHADIQSARSSRYFTRQTLFWGGAFLSLSTLILFTASLNQAAVAGKFLSLISHFNSTNTTQESKVGSNNEVLASQTKKHDYALRVSVPAEFLSTASVSGTLTAPNILYSVVAGDNITISGDRQNPTISANLSLDAGTGIIVDNGTITNTDPGSAQKIFGTIKVGSTTIAAGNNSDTFELAAGDNISLSSDTSNKKITISSNSNASNALTVQEDDTTISSPVTTLDFLGGDFDVGESPTGETNIQLASTLTSVTGVAGSFAVGGNLTVGTDSINDFTGAGLAVSSNTLSINLTTSGTTGALSSNSGLEVSTNGLTLLKGCGDNEILKYTDAGGWACATDVGTGGSVGGIGAQNQIAYWTNATTLAGSNNFYWDSTNEKFGIGTNGSPIGKLDVNGLVVGKALVTLNETGNQNILTASASGITVVNLARTGDLEIEGSLSDLSDTVLTINDDLKVTGNDIIDSGNSTRISLGATTTLTNSTLTLSGTTILNGTSLTTINGGATAIDFSEFDVSAATGSITIDDDTNTGNITLEGTRLDMDSLDFVAGGAITTAVGNDLTLTAGGGNVFLSSGSTLNAGGGVASNFNFFADSVAGADGSIMGSDSDLYIQNDLEVDGRTSFGNIIYTWPTSITANNYILQTQTDGTLAWIDSTSLGTNYWDRANGVLSPKIAGVHDLLLGSNATTSAKFAFVNVNSGTPTASISGTGNNALSLSGNGTIQTLNGQTLTLGGNDTGNIVLDSGNAVIRLADLTSNGVVYTSGNNGTLNSEAQLSVSRGGTGINASTVTDGQLLIGNDSANGFSLATLTAGTGIQIVNGSGSITISQNPFGASKWTQSDADGTLYPNISTLDLLIGGTASNAAKFAVLNVAGSTTTASVSGTTGGLFLTSTGAIQTSSRQSLTLGGGNTGSIVVSGLGAGVVHTNASGVLSSSDVLLGTETTGNYVATITGNSQISVSGSGAETAAVSLSIAADSIGDSQLAFDTGQNLTTSSSPTFNGLSLTSLTIGGDTITEFVGAGLQISSGTISTTLGTSVDLTSEVTGILPITNGGSPFESGNGAIFERITTQDLLLGSNATSSAQFALTGIANGTPTASLSATTNGNGISLNASNSTIQSLQNSSLILGGSTTGNIILSDLTFANGGFTVSSGQTTTLASFTNDGGIIYANSSGVLAQTGTGGASQCLTGGATPSWSDCGGAAGDDWNFINGTLSPKYASVTDILLGSSATASAKFAFVNVSGGIPTASISAITSGNALSLDASGTISTTNEQTLTLGTAGSGDINLVIGSGNNLRINGVAGANVGVATCVTTANGIVTGTGSCDSPLSSFLWSSNAGAIVEGNTTMDLLIGNIATSSAKFAVTNIAGGTPTASLSAGIAGGAFLTADGSLQTTTKQSLTLGGGNTGNIIIGNAGFTSCSALETVNGALTCGVDDMGAGGTNYWQLANGAISPFSETLDVLVGSTATNSAEFALTGIATGTPTASLSATTNSNGIALSASNATIQSLNKNTLTLGGSTTGNIILANATLFSSSLSLGGDTIADFTGTGLQMNGTSLETTLGIDINLASNEVIGILGIANGGSPFEQGSGAIFERIGTQDLLLGSNATNSAKFAFVNVNSGTPTASISGTGNNALALDGSGNIFTTNKQSLTLGSASTGNIVIGNTGFTSCSALETIGSVLTCGVDDTTANYWQLNSGALSPFSETLDVLVGSTATNSAEFALTGIATGAPTASLSATTNSNGIALSASNATIQSLNKNTLTLGGTTTGNIAIGTDATARTVTIGNSTGASAVNVNAGTGNINLTASTGTIFFDDTRTGALPFSISATDLNTPTKGIIDAINEAYDAGVGGGSGLWSTTNNAIYPTAIQRRLGVGTITTSEIISSLYITRNLASGALGKAVAVFNQTENQDILAASASGVTKFVVTNAGNASASAGFTINSAGSLQTTNAQTLTLGGNTTGNIALANPTFANAGLTISSGQTLTFTSFSNNGGLLYTNGTGVVAQTAVGSFGECLISAGGGTPTWDSCTSNGGTNWNIVSGTIQPKLASTLDFLLGGTATASAKFAVLNINPGSGTPTASVSAGTNGGIYLTASGTLATTSKQTLSLADTNTGDILLGTDATVRNITIGNTFGGTALTLDTGTAGINIADSANMKTIDIGGVNNSGTDTIRIATEGTTPDTITIGNNNGATTLALTGGDDWSIATNGVATFSQLNVDNLRLDGNTFSATSGDITVDANGDDVVSSDRWTLGSTNATTLATLDVRSLSGTLSVATISGTTSFATLVIDNSGVGDIFTASASGRTRLALSNAGELRFYDADANNYTGFKTQNMTTNSIYTFPAALPLANDYILLSQTDGTLSWVDPGTLPSVNFWDRANGALFPKNAESNDLLLGSTASNAAEFAITGISAGTPTASLSASTNSKGMSLSASDSTIQSLNKGTLTIGGLTTGNIVIDSGSDLITLSDPTSLSSTLTVGGTFTARGDVVLGNAITNTLTFTGRVAQDSDLIPITTSGTNDLGAASLPWDNLYVNTITQNGATLDATYAPIGANFVTVTATSALTGETGIDALTTAISTTSTLNVDGSSTLGAVTLDADANLILSPGTGKLGIGTATPLAALDVRGNVDTSSVATISGNTSFASLLVNNNGVGDLFTASKGGVPTFTVQNNGTIVDSNYTTAGGIFYGTATGAFGLSTAGIAGQVLQSNGSAAPTWVSTSTLNFWQRNLGAVAPSNITDDLLLGATSTTSARFAFSNAVGPGTPTASISAITNNNALTLDANGNIGTTNKQTLTLGTSSTGDINLVIGSGNNLRINGAAGADIPVATCVTAAHGIVTGTGSCTSPTSIYIWNTNNGAIIEGNTTMDLLVGGTGTSSAKFAVLNVAGSLTPVASLSAGTAGGSFLTADGALQTTAYQTLSLGGGNTGNLSLSAKGGTGVVGISTGSLTINGQQGATSASLTCVSVLNGIVTATGGCGAGSGGSVWTVGEATGVIYPQNPTLDLIIGGTSTASAKFAVLNVAGSLTPIASVSAGTNGAAFLTASGTLQTTAKQSLTLGGGDTGNIILSGFGTGIVHTTNGVLSSSPVSLTSDVSGILPIANGGSPFEQGQGAIFERIGTQDLLLGSNATNSAKFAVINVNSGTPVASLSAGTPGGAFLTADGQIQTTAKQSLTLGGGNTGNIVLSGFSQNGGVLYTNGSGIISQVTAGGLNTVLHGGTNPSFSAVSLTADVSGILPISNGGSPFEQNGSGAITERITTQDLLLGSQSTASAKFAVLNIAGSLTPVASVSAQNGLGQALILSGDGSIQSVRNNTLTIGGGASGNIALSNLTFANAGLTVASSQTLTLAGLTANNNQVLFATNGTGGISATSTSTQNLCLVSGASSPSWQSCALGQNTNYWQSVNPGTITPYITTVDTLFGGVSTTSATLRIAGSVNSATQPAASISANSNFAALVVDNKGSGDLFTASQGGIKRFVITPTGNLQFTGNTGFLTTLTSAATGTQTITFPDASGTICLSSNNCVANQIWNTTGNGAIVEGNTTQDLLLGGTATASAKFAFTGVAGPSTPVASISANPSLGTSTGLSLNGNGSIQSLNMNTLTIGGSTTGNIAIANRVITTTGDLVLDPFDEVYLADTKNLVIGGHPGNVNYNVISDSSNTSHGLNSDNDLFIEGELEVDNTFYADGNIDTALTAGSVIFATTNGVLSENNSNFFWDTSNTRLGIGTNSPFSALDVRATSNTTPAASLSANSTFAALLVDNRGSGDIFTASQGGIKRFVITPTGNLQFTGNTGFLTTLTSAATGAQTITFPDATGTICLQGSASCGFMIGTNYWQSVNPGTITPYITTVDTLFGGVSTSSATLRIAGSVNSATQPAASISANSNFAALVVDNKGSGDIFTASSSGLNRFVIKQNGNIGIGTTLPSAPLDVNGAVIASSFDARSAAGLTIGGTNATSITLGKSGVQTAIGNISTQGIALLSNTGVISSGTVDLSSATYVSNILGITNGGSPFEQSQGAIIPRIITQDLLIGGTSTASARFHAYGSVNAGTTPAASVAASSTFAGFVVDNRTGDLFTASSSGLTRFTIGQTGNIQFTGNTNSLTTLTSLASQARTITFPDATGTICLNTNNCSYALGTNYWQSVNPGTITPYITTVDTLFGGVSTSSATLRIAGSVNSATQPAASISANSNFAALVVDNKGSGDIFTASTGGVSKFTINNSGTITTSNYKIDQGILYANTSGVLTQTATTATANLCLLSNPNGAPGWGACDTSSGINLWNSLLGALSPKIITQDLLIGGTSTASARFHAYGSINSGTTPAASISANSNSFAGLVVDNRGTGDLFTASSSGLPRFIIGQTGNIQFTGNTNFLTTLTSAATAARTITFPDATGTLCVNGQTCGTSGVVGLWSRTSGAISPAFITDDLLIGGTASSSALFRVTGSSAFAGTLSVASVAANTSFAGLVVDNRGRGDLFTASSSGLNRFVITQAGNVGIGTTLPSKLLEISGVGNQYARITSTDDNEAGLELLRPGGSFTDWKITNTSGGNFGIRSSVDDFTGFSTRFYINDAGRVGIGTGATTPTSTLRVDSTESHIPVASFSGSTTVASVIVDNSGSGNLFTASTSGRPVFTIAQDRVQIGTGSAGAWNPKFLALDVKKNDGDPAGGAEGYMYYNTSSDKFRCYEGSGWTDCGGTAVEYLRAEMQTAQSTNIAAGDHIKFDTLDTSSGSSISVDTSTTYTNGAGASIGRFTLKAGKTYILRGTLPEAHFNGSGGIGTVDFHWYNVTGSARLGGDGGLQSDSNTNFGRGGYAEAIFTPSVDSLVELRFTFVSTLLDIGITPLYPNAYIEVLSDGTKISQFIGATSTTDGAIGYVPQPDAGQQGALLLGNGTWTARSNLFVGTTGTEPIASMSAKTSFAGLVVDNTGSGDLFTASSSGLERFTIKQNGNVGIGTSLPSARLHISGTSAGVSSPLLILDSSSTQNPLAFYSSGVEMARIRSDNIGSIVLSTFGGSTNDIEFRAGDDTNTDMLIDAATGRVFIGATGTPLATLDVRGTTTNAGTFPIASFSAKTSFAGLVVDNQGRGDLFTASSSGLNRFVVKQNGYVGIGTSTPAWVNGSSGSLLEISAATPGLAMRDTATGYQWGFYGASSTFYIWNATGNSNAMIVDSSNNFTLGGTLTINTTADDNERLCHSGADGSSLTGIVIRDCTVVGEDFAEYSIIQDSNAEPGDIVNTVGPDLSNPTLIVKKLTTSKYQAHSGIISTNPFIDTLGKEQYKGKPGAFAVALAGRVPIKVSTESGKIKVGDPLVPSSIPGVAMKATQASYIIGFAQEDYDGSTRVSAQVFDQERLYNNDLDDRHGYNSNPNTWLEGVGKIMTEYKPTWYDPDIYLTSTGNISIFEKPDAPQVEGATLFGVKDANGVEINRNGVFSDAVVGNLKTGSLDVQNLTLGGTNLNDRLLGLESGFASASAGFGSSFQNQIESLNSQLSSLTSRVASIEASLALLNSASGSALLTNNPLLSFTASSGAELSLDKLNVNGSIISDSINVLGYATMNELSVTGSIRTGVLTIDGQTNTGGASISTLNGDLKLQDKGFGGIDILDGKLTIDTTGNIQTVGEITAKKFNVDTTDVSAASAGTGTVLAGAKTTTITTTAVTTDSLIQVTFTSDYTPATRYWIKTKTAGQSFTVELNQPVAANAKFSWWIVN